MHAVVREQLEPFLAEAREQISHGHGLPALVEQELRAISTHPRAGRPPSRAIGFLSTTWSTRYTLTEPLSLADESVRIFCEQKGFEAKELFGAADDLDLNFALVDDLVQFQIAAALREKQGAAHAGS